MATLSTDHRFYHYVYIVTGGKSYEALEAGLSIDTILPVSQLIKGYSSRSGPDCLLMSLTFISNLRYSEDAKGEYTLMRGKGSL